MIYQRRSPRLQGYDYTQQGAYFVTICTFQRYELFGQISDGVVELSALGSIAQKCWLDIPAHFPKVDLDVFVIMPNHVHGILLIEGEERTRHASSLRTDEAPANRKLGVQTGSLGAVIGSYKAAVTKQVNQLMGNTAPHIWQSRYHDHIIRSEGELHRHRAYIENNPLSWEEDEFFTVRTSENDTKRPSP